MEGAGADLAAIDRLADLVEILESCSETRGKVTVDFGLARGLAYYNGIVFEVRHPDWSAPLGGGGRYDGLARALGSDKECPSPRFCLYAGDAAGAGRPRHGSDGARAIQRHFYFGSVRIGKELW